MFLSEGNYATLAPRIRSRQQQIHHGPMSHTLHKPPPSVKAPPIPVGPVHSQKPDITRDLHQQDKAHPEIENALVQDQMSTERHTPDITNHAFLPSNSSTSSLRRSRDGVGQTPGDKYANSQVALNGHVIPSDANNDSSASVSNNSIISRNTISNTDPAETSTIKRSSSSRRRRSSSERTTVSQLMNGRKSSHLSDGARANTAVDVCSSEGSRSSSSLSSGNNKINTNNNLSPRQSINTSGNISEYLNTDTIKRNSSVMNPSEHVVFSSTYSPPTIYYTTRPTRNKTSEKHKRKKSLENHSDELVVTSRRNSRNRSRENLDRGLNKKTNSKVNLENNAGSVSEPL